MNKGKGGKMRVNKGKGGKIRMNKGKGGKIRVKKGKCFLFPACFLLSCPSQSAILT